MLRLVKCTFMVCLFFILATPTFSSLVASCMHRCTNRKHSFHFLARGGAPFRIKVYNYANPFHSPLLRGHLCKQYFYIVVMLKGEEGKLYDVMVSLLHAILKWLRYV